jgi:hypothetical protein
MFYQRALLAVAAGFGLLQAGCLAQNDETGVDAIDGVGFTALIDPSGAGGTNGLNDMAFAVSEMNLWSGTFGPFKNTNSALVQLAGNESGKETLDYARKCALPAGRYVIGTSVFYNSVPGLLATTSGWATGALGTNLAPQPKYDLFECMLAHLNPSSHVDIRLTGASVTNSLGAGAALSYSFKEALWVVHQDVTGGLVFEAWPLENLQNLCGTNTSTALAQRVCNSIAGTCGVTIREDLATACSKNADGNWSCEGHPAIQTWLKQDQWLAAMYPVCFPVPG